MQSVSWHFETIGCRDQMSWDPRSGGGVKLTNIIANAPQIVDRERCLIYSPNFGVGNSSSIPHDSGQRRTAS